MANIVELREMSDEKIEELLETAREEMFNLRFQKASARLENTARLKTVRRSIARYETVLSMREQATAVAVAEPEISNAIAGKNWQANVSFVYSDEDPKKETAWRVDFVDENNNPLASAWVDLNKKQLRNRKQVQAPRLIKSHKIAG